MMTQREHNKVLETKSTGSRTLCIYRIATCSWLKALFLCTHIHAEEKCNKLAFIVEGVEVLKLIQVYFYLILGFHIVGNLNLISYQRIKDDTS